MRVDRNAVGEKRIRRAFGALAADQAVHVHVDAEVPAGDVDGTNRVFELAAAPAGESLMLFLRGLLRAAGADADYMLEGTTITFSDGSQPEPGDTLLAYYRVV